MRFGVLLIIAIVLSVSAKGQINTDQVVASGLQSFDEDDYVMAMQYFNLAIQSKPNQAAPYLYRAIAKFNLEDFAGAEKDASHAIEVNPFLKDVFEVRGAIRHKLGKYNEAIDDYSEALDVLPQNKYLLYNLAVLYETIGSKNESNATFDKLFELHPRFDYAYSGYARVLLNDRDTVNAISNLDKAIGLNEYNPDDMTLRAHLNFLEGDTLKAFNDIDAAIKLRPRTSQYHMIRGQMLYLCGEYNRAIVDYSIVADIESSNLYAQYNKSLCRYRNGDFINAENEIDALIVTAPEMALAHFLKSVLCEKRGDKNLATVHYKKYVEFAENENAQVPNQLGKTPVLAVVYPSVEIPLRYNCPYLRIAKINEKKPLRLEPLFAVSFYSMRVDPQFSSLYLKEIEEINSSKLLRYDLIVTNREPGVNDSINLSDHLQAIDYYNYHINAHTPRAIDYFGRAIDYYILRDYTSSVADLDKAVALAPDFVLGYYVRAIAKSKKIKIEELICKEVAAQSFDANSVENIESYGELMHILEDWDKVISLRPRMAIAYYNKATVLIARGDIAGAITEYDKVISLEPYMGEAYYNRGYAYLKQGEVEKAQADFSKAGELGVTSAYDMLRELSKMSIER